MYNSLDLAMNLTFPFHTKMEEEWKGERKKGIMKERWPWCMFRIADSNKRYLSKKGKQ